MISVCESYKQALNELQWLEKVTNHVEGFRIPLTHKIYNILYGDTRANVFHVTDIRNIGNIKNLIGTKKTISAFTYMNATQLNKLRGIQTNGGIIFQIDGRLVLYSLSDIMSRPDENGIRWIDEYELLYFPLNQAWKDLVRHEIFTDFGAYGLEYDRKKKTEQIKEYFKLAEAFVAKNKTEILRKITKVGGSGGGRWDEILVSDIRILDIYWDVSFAEKIYQDARTRVDYYKTHGSYLIKKPSPRTLFIVNNYPQWVEKVQNRLESMAEGKVYTAEKITPFQFVKDRGGFMNSWEIKPPIEIS